MEPINDSNVNVSVSAIGIISDDSSRKMALLFQKYIRRGGRTGQYRRSGHFSIEQYSQASGDKMPKDTPGVGKALRATHYARDVNVWRIEVFDEDNPNFPTVQSAFGQRLKYAIESSFLARRDDATRRKCCNSFAADSGRVGR